jgi:hypothetical protein
VSDSATEVDARGLTDRWIVACGVAEAIGMTAAATAAKSTQLLSDRIGVNLGMAIALAVVGGIVEGAALGTAQAIVLVRLFRRLNVRRWVWVTTVIAGVGWAGASLPSAMSSDSESSAPPIALIVLGALALGAVMGILLGSAQAWVLDPVVDRARRWIVASAAGWAPAMAVIFVGAGLPEADWSFAAVAAAGALTGAVAGCVLGACTWYFVPALGHAPNRNTPSVGRRLRRRVGHSG